MATYTGERQDLTTSFKGAFVDGEVQSLSFQLRGYRFEGQKPLGGRPLSGQIYPRGVQ